MIPTNAMELDGQEKVSLTIHEPVNATFALRYLVNFAKAWSCDGKGM